MGRSWGSPAGRALPQAGGHSCLIQSTRSSPPLAKPAAVLSGGSRQRNAGSEVEVEVRRHLAELRARLLVGVVRDGLNAVDVLRRDELRDQEPGRHDRFAQQNPLHVTFDKARVKTEEQRSGCLQDAVRTLHQLELLGGSALAREEK